MRRIYHIGIAPADKRARMLLERVEQVEGIHLIPVPFYPTSFDSHSSKPDFILSCVSSIEDMKRYLNLNIPRPVILIGEYVGREKLFELPKNFYFSGHNPLNLISILKALFKSAQNVKLELKNGTVVNLVISLKQSKIEKVIPTGKGKERELSYKEAIILKELFKKPGEIVPYERFLSLGIKKENIPVYMSRLRRLVSEIEPFLKIKSVRNRGYFVTYGL